jgi:hypothetical protein
MVRSRILVGINLFLLLCVLPVCAQQLANTTNSVVPTLVRYGGVLTDTNGKPLTDVGGVTFYLYKDAQTETPLWMETQNVHPDANGRYSVQLGSTKPNGLPTDVFASGEARWLGVQAEGQPQQPRVLLLSVPYALKAADAETVGGLPPSAFVLAAPQSSGTMASSGSSASPTSALPPSGAVTGTGTLNFVPLWDSTSDIVTSAIFQSGTSPNAKIGINTNTPATTLDVKGTGTIRGALSLPSTATATATTGDNSQPFNLTSSVFNSGTGTAVNQNFRLQAEPVGNDTSGASGSLNLLYASGSNTLTETGLSIASTGRITFASGQTFPGTGVGTITGISTASGSGLSGGGTSGTLSLSVPSSGITNTMLQNSSLTVASGTGLTGGGSVALGGSATPLSLASNACSSNNALTALPFTCSPFATPGSNTFTGNQTVNGNVSVAGQLISTAAQGTAPLQVTSTTQVANLNASLLGGSPPGSFASSGNNNFNGNQSVTGTITATGNIYGPTIGTNSLSSYGNTGSSFTAISATPAVSVTSYYSSGDGIDANVTGSGKIFGLSAVNTNSSFGAGVYGVEGTQSNIGANSFGGTGIWGDAGNHGFTSILATADSAYGLFAENNGPLAAVYAQNNTTQTQGSSVFVAVGNYGSCSIDVSGNLRCSGTVTGIVPADNGSRKVALYAVEAPENWFEDVGSGQLSNGTAVVNLESIFAQTVNAGMEYHVFLTPKGDCEGLYVSNETETGFEVHELRGGHSSIAFDYRIMARRKGYESIRLADMTNIFKSSRQTEK